MVVGTEPHRGQTVFGIQCANHELNVLGVEAGESEYEPEPASPTSGFSTVAAEEKVIFRMRPTQHQMRQGDVR